MGDPIHHDGRPVRPTSATFVPLGVNFADDPKILAVSPLAQLVYIRGLALAKRTQSDGLLCRRQAYRLTMDLWPSYADTTLHPATEDKAFHEGLESELVDAGLWERVTEPRPGVMIARFLDWNPSRADLARAQEEAQANGRKGARARWGGVTEPDGEQEQEQATARAVAYESDFDQAWAEYPRKESRKAALRAYVARRRAGTPAHELALATENYASAMRAEGRQKRHIRTGAAFYGPDEHFRDFLRAPMDPSDDAPPAGQTNHGTRFCDVCGQVRWMPDHGPVPCNCPEDETGD